MADFRDHSTHGRIVGQRLPPPDLVEPEPDQGGALLARPPDRAADLLDGDGLALFGHAHASAGSAASVSRRRACSVDTLMPRRAATPRGLSSCLRASKVARTMLYG